MIIIPLVVGFVKRYDAVILQNSAARAIRFRHGVVNNQNKYAMGSEKVLSDEMLIKLRRIMSLRLFLTNLDLCGGVGAHIDIDCLARIWYTILL